MHPPRFSINRKTGEVACNKPLSSDEIKKMQEVILINQIKLHPEIFTEGGKTMEDREVI